MWKLLRAASSVVTLAGLSLAHQFHFCTVEANWNTRAQTLEVITRLHADDLEALLSRKQNRRIELDRDPQAQVLTCAYTLKQVELQGVTLRCLGMQVTKHLVEVYLEGSLGKQSPPVRARNQVMTAQFPDQINQIQLQRDNKPVAPAITFFSSDRWKALKW